MVAFKRKPKAAFSVEYIIADSGEIKGVGHQDWPFTLQLNGDMAAIVSDDGEPFGELPRDVFDTILACYLLVSSPHLLAEDDNAI